MAQGSRVPIGGVTLSSGVLSNGVSTGTGSSATVSAVKSCRTSCGSGSASRKLRQRLGHVAQARRQVRLRAGERIEARPRGLLHGPRHEFADHGGRQLTGPQRGDRAFERRCRFLARRQRRRGRRETSGSGGGGFGRLEPGACRLRRKNFGRRHLDAVPPPPRPGSPRPEPPRRPPARSSSAVRSRISSSSSTFGALALKTRAMSLMILSSASPSAASAPSSSCCSLSRDAPCRIRFVVEIIRRMEARISSIVGSGARSVLLIT